MQRDGPFRFGGEFSDSSRETEFRAARFPEILRQSRLILVVSAVLNTLFLVSDWRFYGDPHFFVAIPARLLVVFASVVCALLVRKATQARQIERIVIGWEIAAALGIAALVSSRSDLALFVVMLLPAIFYLLIPTSFRWTLILGTGCSVMMLAGYLGRGPYPTTLLGLGLILVVLNFALALFVIHTNRLRRLEWAATQAERQIKEELVASREMIERLFMAVPIPLVVASRDEGKFLRANDAAMSYFDVRDMGDIQVPEVFVDANSRRTLLRMLRRHEQVTGYEAQMLDGNKTVRDVRITATSLPIGDVPAIVAGIVDITDLKSAEADARRKATRDALTGLPNRLLFQERLERALAEIDGRDRVIGLFLIDLDDFKSVNDTLGHDAGDHLLVEAATRLAGAIGKDDFIARIGGDEFVVLTRQKLSETQMVDKAEELLEVLREPFLHAGQMISARASLGIALAPLHDRQSGELFKDADLALYRAKAGGRNMAVVYDPSMRAAMTKRVEICRDLSGALAEGRIVPFYQPQVALETGRIVGLEALARWRHPERGIVPAAAFQEAFEDPEISWGIGEAVVTAAIEDIRGWREAGLDVGCVSVNLSAGAFRDPTLPERLLAQLAQAGVPASCLGVEVTETVLLARNADEVDRNLQALRDAGLHVSLDDFGTGYASLTHLRRFPVDSIKIDRSFVRHVEDEGDDAAIVRALINLASDLKVGIVAEGVETAGQEAFLRRHGCGIAQGYRYAKPVQANRVPWLFERSGRLPPGGKGHARGGIVAA